MHAIMSSDIKIDAIQLVLLQFISYVSVDDLHAGAPRNHHGYFHTTSFLADS